MSEETKTTLKQLIAECDAFLPSKLHERYVATIKRDIANVQTSILALAPTDHKSHSELLMLHGEMNSYQSLLSLFEVARQNFKAQLLEMEESEGNQAGVNK